MFERNVISIDRHGLEPKLFRDVATGRLGLIHVPRLAATELCRTALEEIGAALFEQYDTEYFETGAQRIGPSFNEHRILGKSLDDYLRAASAARETWQRTNVASELHGLILRTLEDGWRASVRPAEVNGRQLYWGILRRMTAGTYVHWDDVELEQHSGIFGPVESGQLSMNVYLEAPSLGGELHIWPRRWKERDEAARVAYGYKRDVVVPEQPPVRLMPSRGDAVIFDATNYHMVTSVTSGDRVALSLFMRIANTGELLLWA